MGASLIVFPLFLLFVRFMSGQLQLLPNAGGAALVLALLVTDREGTSGSREALCLLGTRFPSAFESQYDNAWCVTHDFDKVKLKSCCSRKNITHDSEDNRTINIIS